MTHRFACASVAVFLALVSGACSSSDDDGASLITTTEPQSRTTTTAAPALGDGEEWIAFRGVPPSISLIRADGTGSHVILGPAGQQTDPDWSPDGSEIAYIHRVPATATTTPMITDVRGEDPRLLVKSIPADLEGLYWGSPAWSRDGSEVAVVGYTRDLWQPFRSVLAIVEVATGELTRVGEPADGRLLSPRWSPDGQEIVFTTDRYSCDGTCDLYGGSSVAVIRRHGDAWSAPKEITDVGRYSSPDWHPNEDLILFGDRDIRGVVGTDYEPTHLYTIRSDGSQRTTLASFSGAERPSEPTWTPDGRIIVTLVTVDGESRGIALLNADGAGLEVVVSAKRIGHPRMRPR